MTNCFVEWATTKNPSSMLLFHSHKYYEFYFLEEGSRSLHIENDQFDLLQNDILLIPAKQLHRTEGEDNHSRYLVNFNVDYLSERQLEIVETCQQQKIVMTKEEAMKIFDVLKTLYSIQENKSKQNDKYKELDFNTCFSFLLYSILNLKNFPAKKYKAKSAYRLRTKQIISYIQEHYTEKITLDLFCKKFFISEHTLCSSFKKDTNLSIIDYLIKTRLNKAQAMLMYSNKKISEISEACGFSSPNYFQLTFTKHLKISPSEFRKNNSISIDYSSWGGDQHSLKSN